MVAKNCVLISLFLCGLVAPAKVDAQVARFGLAVGPITPVSGFSDVVNRGVHIRGLASLRLPVVPLGIRGEVAYNRMPRVEGGNSTQLSGIASGTLALLPIPVVSPYFIGGAGIYRTELGGEEGTSTEPGVVAGLGIRANLAVAEVFAESRYEHVLGGTVPPRMVPLMIGIAF